MVLSMRLVASVWVLAVLFLLIGSAAFVVGVHDFAIASASFGLTVGSLALIALGLVVLVGGVDLVILALRLRRPWPDGVRPNCAERVLVAALLTTVLGLYLFLSTITTASKQRPIVVIVALVIVAVSVAGVVFLHRDLGLQFPKVQTTVALALAGTAIGLSEFWYQTQYAPSHLGRAVSLTATLKLVGKDAGYDVVQASLGYEDIGGRDVAVIGSTYSLTGSGVVACRRPPTPEKLRAYFQKFNVDPQRSRFMSDAVELQPAALLAAGKFVADGKRLDTNVSATRDFVFYVPDGTYQLLRLRAQLFAISASVPLSRSALPEYVNVKGDHDEYGFWRVDDYSWLHALVYGRRRWVVIRYELARDPSNPHVSPDLRVTARFLTPTWSEAPPAPGRLPAAFAQPEPVDASEPFADTELALAPLRAPTPGDRLQGVCVSG
jgi:hypothetical protein